MSLPKTAFTGEYTAQFTLTGSASNYSLAIASFSVNFVGTGAWSGFSTVFNQLPQNLVNFGGLDYQNLDPLGGNQYIDFETAKNGTIDAARMNVDLQDVFGTDTDFRIGSHGDIFSYTYGSPDGSCAALRDENGPGTRYSGPAISPCAITSRDKTLGTWTVGKATAPEIDVASLGSAMTLLLGGLAVIGGRRRS
jgi:hypothetical protein